MRLTDLAGTKKVILWLIFWFSACIAFSGAALHAEELIKEETGIEKEASEKKEAITYTPGEGIRIEAADLTIGSTATVVFQGTPNPNGSENCAFSPSWIAALLFEKKFGDWGLTFLKLEFGQGETVDPDLNLFNIVNYNAHDNGATAEAREFWYKQQFFDRQFSLTAGKLQQRNYLDLSKYAGNDDTQFLGSIFNRSPVIEWPEHYGMGIHALMAPRNIDFLEIELNYFDAASDWKNIFNNGMYTAQLKVKTVPFSNAGPGEEGGNYRLYGWSNTRNHTKLLNRNADEEFNYGFGFGFDQPMTDVLGIFGRFGWQRPDLVPADGGATIEMSWSGGAQIKGKYWKRENDAFGLGVGQLFPSKDYKNSGHAAGIEGHMETYYNFMVSNHLFVSPDFQWIWNANGVNSNGEPIFVYGVRTHLLF